MASFTMDDRRGFANNVLRLYDKFMQYKLPFPLDPVADVYRKAFTDKQWVAMRYLQETCLGVVKRDMSFNLHPDSTSVVSFKFPPDIKFPSMPVRYDMLPERERAIVSRWVASVHKMRQLREELSARCNGVMGNPTGMGKAWINRKRRDLDPCLNNPMQLYKLWPEVQPFMTSSWRTSVMQSSMRTRLPKHVGYFVERDGRRMWATPEQFRCEDEDATPEEKRRFEEINQILLMVSLAKDIPDIKDYPRFHGDV